MAIIKKGSYRWNDALTEIFPNIDYGYELYERINFYFDEEFYLSDSAIVWLQNAKEEIEASFAIPQESGTYKARVNCSAIWSIGPDGYSYIVGDVECGEYNELFTFLYYAYSRAGRFDVYSETWKNIQYQTITVTEDAEVSSEFAEWFAENTKRKQFTKLNIGDVAYSSGGKCFKRLILEQAQEPEDPEKPEEPEEPPTEEFVSFTVTADNRGMIGYTDGTTELIIPETFQDQDGTNYKVVGIGDEAFSYCKSLTSVVIPDSVTSIGSWAFSNCTSLMSVVIPDSVTSIGYKAFYNCFRLVEVINKSSLGITAGSEDYGHVAYYAKEVHNGDSKIVNQNDYLFYTYNGINYLLGYAGNDTDLILPDNYNGESYEIYQYAFDGCSSLTSIEIPDSVRSIGSYAFDNCTSLKSVYITDIEAWCNISFDNSFSNPMYYGADLYLNGELVTELVIPDTVTNIKDCTFSGCSSLTSIEIPDSVTSIGYDAFYSCRSLTSIVIGDGVTSIGGSAFGFCTSLTSIEIPNSVTSIGGSAFWSCYNLTSIRYRGTEAQWNAITKGANWDHATGDYTITYNYTGD